METQIRKQGIKCGTLIIIFNQSLVSSWVHFCLEVFEIAVYFIILLEARASELPWVRSFFQTRRRHAGLYLISCFNISVTQALSSQVSARPLRR